MRLPALSRLPLPLQLGIFLACALPLVWGLIAFDLHRTHEQTRTQAELRIQNLERAFAEGVKSAVNSIDHTLIDLRDQWQSGTPDFRNTVRRRQVFLEQDVGFQVAIIDLSGKLVFSSADRNAEKVDLSDREHFRVHRKQTGDWLFISKPVFGRISNRWSLQFTRPLLDDAGDFTGVIVLSVSPDFFSRFYQTIDLGKDSLIMLVRGSGEILARSPRPELGLGKSLSEAPFLHNRTEGAGLYHQASEVDGVDRLYGWRRLPKGDLVVALGLSMETIFEPYHRQLRSYVMGGGALSLVLAVIGFFLLQGLRQRAQARHALEETRKALQHSQKMEALGRLTGGIAHDFNNVLQTLTTGIQLALFSAPDARARSTLEACQRAVERGMELTRQLLVFGRVQDANLKTVSLAEQINGVAPLLRGALPSNIGFHLELAPGLWPARIDPLQFELALLNLAMNARDAMPKGGQFRIAARNATRKNRLGELEPGDYIELVVSDTGEGMDQEVLARALDPFFTTKAVGKGSGMGLAQAYGFARQMGGALTLESEPGRGVRVTLLLPRAPDEAQSGQPSAPMDSQVVSGRGNLLFVEDDSLVRETVRPALEAAGFEVAVAENGMDALKMLESGKPFDLLFSDIVMPGEISGIDLASWVQQRFPGIRIVLATGYSERRIALPNVRTLAKPYDIPTLVEALNEAVPATP